MPVGFRNAAGVDLEQLFDPDVVGDGPTAPFLRTAAGAPLRFAALSYGSKGPDVGFRTSAGVDVSNLWARAGSAVYGLPFDGATYSSNTTATSGQTGTVSASTFFRVDPTGMFTVGRQSGNPQSGSVLAGGGPVSEYSYRIRTVQRINRYPQPGFGGSLVNGASSLAPVSGGVRSVSVATQGPAQSNSDDNVTEGLFEFELYRNGSLIARSPFTLLAQASGWQ